MMPLPYGQRYHFAARVLGLAAVCAMGCNDSVGPDKASTGAIRIVISTAGASADLDSDGYTLSIDDGPAQPVAANTSVLGLTIPGIAPGSHSVRLAGLASNCVVAGSSVRSVEVPPASVSLTVTFTVTCGARFGSLKVTTVTSGPSQDADGYIVFVQGGSRGTVPTNGTTTITNLRAGRSEVFLGGLAGNCVVDGLNIVVVEIPAEGTAEVSFNVRCLLAGDVRVTTETTGTDTDQDGFAVELRRIGGNISTFRNAPPNGTVTVALIPGDYQLTVYGLAANCDVVGSNPRAVIVAPAADIPIALEITCAAATQLAFVAGLGSNADIYVVNSNGAGQLRISQPGSESDPAWSPDGTRIAFATDRDGNREIYVMNADGTNPVRLTNAIEPDSRPTWSPDGARIAFVRELGGATGIWVMNTDGGNPSPLTTGGGLDSDPAWSPNGTQIAFSSKRDGTSGIWLMRADGSDARKLTPNIFAVLGDRQPAWSPDGTRIAFARQGATSASDGIHVINADGSGFTGVPIYASQDATDPAWSPDGRKIAFAGNADSYYYDYDPYIVTVSLTGVLYSQITNLSPASRPAWRPR